VKSPNGFLRFILPLAALTIIIAEYPASALEKSGRAEIEEGRPPEIQFSLSLSDFVDNNSFRARPDNTGIVKYRYLGHFEIQPLGSPVALVLDTNFFTDKEVRNEFRPSEWDQAIGFLYRYEKWAALLRYERDMPIDKSGLVQAYAEAQGLWHQDDLLVKNSEFYAAIGWLFATQTYFARPDNTGRALFRYVLHGELPLYRNWLWLIGDTNFFTDRQASNPIAPSELDWIVGLAVRWKSWELMAFQETDQAIDRGGLTQKYIALQLKWSWEGKPSLPEIHTRRDAPHSPFTALREP
jgi:hypothetical protein